MIQQRRNARSQVIPAGSRQRRARVKRSSARGRRSSVHREASRRRRGGRVQAFERTGKRQAMERHRSVGRGGRQPFRRRQSLGRRARMERRRPVGRGRQRGRGRRAGRVGGGFFEFLNRHRSAIRSHLTRGRQEPHVTDISVEAGRRWRRMSENQKDLYHAAASRRRR